MTSLAHNGSVVRVLSSPHFCYTYFVTDPTRNGSQQSSRGRSLVIRDWDKQVNSPPSLLVLTFRSCHTDFMAIKKPKLLRGKKLNNALDQIIRDIFKEMYGDNPKCFVCGHHDHWWSSKNYPKGIQVGHYIARGRTILRWDLRNVFPQCSGCNIAHNTNPAPFTLAIIKEHGKSRIEVLERTAREWVGKKVTDGQKREMLETLTIYLEELKNSI